MHLMQKNMQIYVKYVSIKFICKIRTPYFADDVILPLSRGLLAKSYSTFWVTFCIVRHTESLECQLWLWSTPMSPPMLFTCHWDSLALPYSLWHTQQAIQVESRQAKKRCAFLGLTQCKFVQNVGPFLCALTRAWGLV